MDVVRHEAARTDAAATLSGRAEHLLLALWHRLPFEEADLALRGDAAVATAFVAGPVSP